MKTFNERDVRRHFDLLQHTPELGLTQLKAMDEENVIGIGLFDNEEDFVSECRRYNTLGHLYVGVNPRAGRILDEYGGLKNRMRSLFTDVVTDASIDHVTGVMVPDLGSITDVALAYRKDVSVLHAGDAWFPMDEPIAVPDGHQTHVARQITRWFYGETTFSHSPLMQFALVMGTAIPGTGWFVRRARFRKYRPYILEGISKAITGEDAGVNG